VEFTNFRFNATTLKVCKIGQGATQGTDFNFTVALVSPQIGGPNPGPMFPAFSQGVTVTAGPAGTQEGNCTIVNGGGLLGGAFNQGSTITITEAAGNLVDVRCPSCGPGGLSWPGPPSRVATVSGPNGLVAGINSVVFTNAPVPPPFVERSVKFDFDGDRKSDLAVWTMANGNWSWRSSAEGNAVKVGNFGQAGDKLVAADYDGDGKTQYAVWRPSNGTWYIKAANGGYTGVQWGEPGDVPQTGDYDGDGKADLIIFRPSNGTWYIRTAQNGYAAFQFGIPTDKPVAADYDGDGKTDAGVFRNGMWYWLGSQSGFSGKQFGQTGDVPVPANFQGSTSGVVNLAVYRPGNATWYVLRQDGNYYSRQHGIATDAPVPADYDGDGKADIAVYRASQGKWYIRYSTQSESSMYSETTLGGSGDIALQ
jgi:hypothetical protein